MLIDAAICDYRKLEVYTLISILSRRKTICEIIDVVPDADGHGVEVPCLRPADLLFEGDCPACFGCAWWFIASEAAVMLSFKPLIDPEPSPSPTGRIPKDDYPIRHNPGPGRQ